ncbi:hypothetical protein [Stutzerimonas nitrititolerans]|uniref:hypothetical protein n=1 Tax=Stutzerimonas nitrititolerans TaxID=2482751 RepID=UPI0028A5D61C|nr:hypothetical protein [Stutzerimonas nitrititolerans]
MAVREHLLETASRPPEEAPAALVGMSVMPSGAINCITLQVEPEHVLPVLEAMRGLMGKLESYLTSAVASRYLLVFGVALAIEAFDIVTVPAMAALALVR